MTDETPNQKLRIADAEVRIIPKRAKDASLTTKIIGWTIMAPPLVLVTSLIIWAIVAVWREIA